MKKPDLSSRTFAALERAVRIGSLKVVTPEGRTASFEGAIPGPAASIVVHNWRTVDEALARGDIGLGEAYMAGWWDSPDLEALYAVLMLNMDGLGRLAWGSFAHRVVSVLREWVLRRNSVSGSRRNIIAHYDVGNDFYALWLDPTMSYSSAIFASPETGLEAAQHAKYRRILDRLGNRGGELLEVGCGWGGFIGAALGQGAE